MIFHSLFIHKIKKKIANQLTKWNRGLRIGRPAFFKDGLNSLVLPLLLFNKILLAMEILVWYCLEL